MKVKLQTCMVCTSVFDCWILIYCNCCQLSENDEMQETILLLRQQIASFSEKRSLTSQQIADDETNQLTTCSEELLVKKNEEASRIISSGKTYADEHTPTSAMSLYRAFSLEDSKECNNNTFCDSRVRMQVILFLIPGVESHSLWPDLDLYCKVLMVPCTNVCLYLLGY